MELLDDPRSLVFCSHSGGKDSQAMYLFLRRVVPHDKLFVIHASLGDVEWPGTIDHIESTISHSLHTCKNKNKTFFEMVEHRGMFPSPKNRQCTSDLKRGPIRSKIKQICNSRGASVVIDCMGLRSEESQSRAKKKPFIRMESECNTKREWYQWLPIHDWTEAAVFQFIKDNKQKPHWAYAAGMTRLSCSFCIMSSYDDIRTAARLRPDIYKKYSETEVRLGHTMMMPKRGSQHYLSDIVNVN